MSKNFMSQLLGLASVVASAAAGAWTLGPKAAIGAGIAAAATWFLGYIHDAPGAPPKVLP